MTMGPTTGPTTEPSSQPSTGPSSERTPEPVPATDDAILDAVLVELAGLDGRPLEEHVEVGERALAVLSGRLRDLGGA